jgi:predicted glycosyltransferase
MDWCSGALPLDIAAMVKLRAKLLLDTFVEFRPDVVLVDHMPVGALGELKPLLERATRGRRRPRLLLGLRDILDAPEVIRSVWHDLGAYEYLDLYEAVLVYGCREIYDAGSAYDLTRHARGLLYCNYVTSASPADLVAAPRPSQPLVLVMGGGGADAFPLLETFLDSLPLVLKDLSLNCLVLTGPNMSRADREALNLRASQYPVRILPGLPDASTPIQAASAIVTMAGYNSLCETLQARKRALVVPRRGPSAEQRIRSEIFSERRLVMTLDPDNLTPDRMAAKVKRLVSDDGNMPDPANLPPLDGARRAASVVLGAADLPSTPELVDVA